MIRTLAVGADPRKELQRRLRFLRDVEVPVLRFDGGEPGHLGAVALRDYSVREIHDSTRLLNKMPAPFRDVSEDTVRLNDCVALRSERDDSTEEFVVHAAGLVIRAPGYVAADTALGASVLGRRVGEHVRVGTAEAVRTYVVQGIRRSFE